MIAQRLFPIALLSASMACAAKALEALAAPTSVPWVEQTQQAAADYLENLVAPAVAPLDMAVVIIDNLKIDDPVGAIAVHGINGFFGTIAVGLFSII